MRLQTAPTSIASAVLIGAINFYLLAWVWALIAVYSPLSSLPRWLISQGITGVALKATLLPIDLLINMALCTPAAYLLCKLRPSRLWVYLTAALLPSALWGYRLVLGDTALLQEWQIFLPGMLTTFLPLPVIAFIIKQFVGGAPNNSFKPTPLRGAA